MSLDIGSILRDWPYEPGQVTARRIRGADGREKIQLRLDLGLLQMEVDGRPDGQRPMGFETYLDYYEHQLSRHNDEHGGAEGFSLDERACELLRAESLMFYHRYLAAFILEDFLAVERDTMRNLRCMDFCNSHAKEESDRYALEQYRPYVLMMLARARARVALADNRPKRALAAIKRGMEAIRAFYRRYGQDAPAEASNELTVLQALAQEIGARLPTDPLDKLRKALAEAVKAEKYEEAAQIRDRIRNIQHPPQQDQPPQGEQTPADDEG
jgi:hypothetical protein